MRPPIKKLRERRKETASRVTASTPNFILEIDPTPVGFQNRTQCRGRCHNSRSPEKCSTRVLRKSYSCGSRCCSFGRRNEDRRCASSVQIDHRPHEPVRCWRLPVFLLLWDSK